MLEACDHPAAVEAKLEQTLVKVEQVAVLVPLKQRSQLGAEDFLRLERNNLCLGLMPAAAHNEGVGLKAIARVIRPSTASRGRWRNLPAGPSFQVRVRE
jgi:hypothetical protein